MAYKKQGFNDYKSIDNYVVIFLPRRDGRIFETLIDLEDLERIKNLGYHWNAGWNPHTKSWVAQASEYLGYWDNKGHTITHYLAIEIMQSDKLDVNHKNHDTLDNRKYNLDVITNLQNIIHRRGANPNSKSGVRNVCWSEQTQRWLVQFQVNGKNKCFGRYKKEFLQQAIELADKIREELYGAIYTPNTIE